MSTSFVIRIPQASNLMDFSTGRPVLAVTGRPVRAVKRRVP